MHRPPSGELTQTLWKNPEQPIGQTFDSHFFSYVADILSLFLDYYINANFTCLFNLGPCLVLQDSWANIYPRPTVRSRLPDGNPRKGRDQILPSGNLDRTVGRG